MTQTEADDFEVIGDEQVENLTAHIDCLGLGGMKKYTATPFIQDFCFENTPFQCGCIGPPQFPDAFKPSSTIPLPPESVGGFVERMWAYLSIKQLLDKAKYSSSTVETEQLNQRALQLSLKYQFVTSLTSMVVTHPEKQIECGLEEFRFSSRP